MKLVKKALHICTMCFVLMSLNGCATVFGGHINECQTTKPDHGEPKREIRPAALVFDIIATPFTLVSLPIDFITGAIYVPCQLPKK